MLDYKSSYRKRRSSLHISLGILLVVCGSAAILSSISLNKDDSVQTDGQTFVGRHILQYNEPELYSTPNSTNSTGSELNCTPPSIGQFPSDFFTEKQRARGGIIFHVFIVLYIFGALAIVCDDYFVSSLEKICDVLRLQPDVAGATFMAAGSSAPELFTSIVGVFFAKSDVGVGTIVGSAVFNLLFILAICGLFSGMVVYLTWWPLFRDAIVYLISVITLVLVIIDGEVSWWEALIMCILYVFYIVLLYFNPQIGDFMIDKVANCQENSSCCCCSKPKDIFKEIDMAEPALPKNGFVNGEIKPGNDVVMALKTREKRSGTMESITSKTSVYSQQIGFEHKSRHSMNASSINLDKEDEEEYTSPLTIPDTIFKKILWVITMPISIVFMLTIPDCRRPGCWQKTFVVTFIMSLVWIGGLTYIMVWMVTIIGYTLYIPDTVMGLTLLAAGTSVPDAMSSLFVSRDGYGDMAVSNSIGSNIFNILLCLGLPWLLQTTAVSWGTTLKMQSKGIAYTAATLIGTDAFLLIVMVIVGWKLNKKIGVIFIATHVLVTTFACLVEMNVFGDINLPECPRD